MPVHHAPASPTSDARDDLLFTIDRDDLERILGRPWQTVRPQLPRPLITGGDAVRWRFADILDWLADVRVVPDSLTISDPNGRRPVFSVWGRS